MTINIVSHFKKPKSIVSFFWGGGGVGGERFALFLVYFFSGKLKIGVPLFNFLLTISKTKFENTLYQNVSQ